MSISEFWVSLRHKGGERLAQIVRLQQRRIPDRHVIQALGHRMVAGIEQHLLAAADGERRLGGDCAGDPGDRRHHVVARAVAAIGEADRLGFGTGERPPGVSQFARHGLADQFRQPLQGADVGDESELDLLDDEVGVGRAIAHVGGAGQIDAGADTGAVDRREHRLAAGFQAGDDVLQIQYDAAQLFALMRGAAVASVRDLRQHRQIDAGVEMLAGAAQNDDAGLRHVVKLAEHVADIVPHLPVHGVRLVGPVQHDIGDTVGQRHGQRLVVHEELTPPGNSKFQRLAL